MTDKFDLDAALRGEPFELDSPHWEVRRQISLSPDRESFSLWVRHVVSKRWRSYEFNEDGSGRYSSIGTLVMAHKPKRELWARPYRLVNGTVSALLCDARDRTETRKPYPDEVYEWFGPAVLVWREE